MERGTRGPRGRPKQRGAGAYTLCPRCNNNTGSWYGPAFVEWCHDGMTILRRSEGRPSLIYMRYAYPLRIIKQIAVMFFSVNGPEFRKSHPELVRFVLDRRRKYLDPKYRFFTYYSSGGTIRHMGATGSANVQTGSFRVMCEITFPPYGYLLLLTGDSPDERLFEITHFSRYGYYDFDILYLNLPVLPSNTIYPGDYRTLKQVEDEKPSN